MNAFHSLKLSAVLALLFATAVATPCSGAVTITAAEVGLNVVFTYSGSINTSSLTLAGSSIFGAAFVDPSLGEFGSPGGVGEGENPSFDFYSVTLSPSPSFGTGTLTGGPSIRTGSLFGYVNGTLRLPTGYTSGSAIAGTVTWNGTFDMLGLTPGNYAYAINTNIDNIFVNIGSVPEPSRALLAGLGLAGIVFRRRRQGKA